MKRELICEKFCDYYKPDKKDEVGCAGVHALERFSDSIVDVLYPLSNDRGSPLFGLDQNHPALLSLCDECPFKIDGCDFRDPRIPDAACSPCGGLRAVAALIYSGADMDL